MLNRFFSRRSVGHFRRDQYLKREVEACDSRILLASTLTPAVVASFQDSNLDGIADTTNTSSPKLVRQISSLEDRTVAEFDLRGQVDPVTLAVLDFHLYGNIYGDPVRTFQLVGYAGNGTGELADFNQPGIALRTVSYFTEEADAFMRLDVTSAVQSLLAAGATHFGVRVDATVTMGPNYLDLPTLTLNGALVPTWQRAIETTPNAIRADGIEKFRVEVATSGDVKNVKLNLRSNQFFIEPEAGNVMTLRDDGLGGDRIAGDFIYSTGEFRFDPQAKFPSAYLNLNTDSPAGIFIYSLGTVTITELDGTVDTFVHDVEIGLVSPALQSAAVSQVSPSVQVSDHFINVKSNSRAAQSTLRGNQVVLDQVTKQVYSALGDEFDFLMMFSTQRIENILNTSSSNQTAGSHFKAQVDFTGSGQPLFNNSAFYGSSGRLMAVNVLDYLDRGMNSRTATHEIVHQWGAFIDEALGISDYPHYLGNTSVGSLLGGYRWDPNGDGSYTIRTLEGGGGGATHVSPLELYMMGLIPASEVPDIMAYDHLATPKTGLNPIVYPHEITKRVSVNDIITRHGERTGVVRTNFNLGFVAESHNRWLTPTEMTFYEAFAAHYTRPIPADERDPHVGISWSSINRFFGHGTTWTSNVPGRVPAVNQAPTITSTAFSIAENSVYNRTVGYLAATDPDPGQSLFYAIESMDSPTHHFQIDALTGRISVGYALNYEAKSEYTVTVIVSDNALPGQFDRKTITISVTDVNEFGPVIAPNQTFSVSENSAIGTVVGSIVASDADIGQQLSYSIVSGNSAGAFAVDATTGQVTVANSSALNFETVGAYFLTVRATDNGNPALSETSVITVTLTDVNEAPVIADQTFTVAENTLNTNRVGFATASDVDAGASLTYSITSSSLPGAFAINPVTGEVTVADGSLLDFEAVVSATLVITATDNGNPALSSSANVTVAITDVNERPIIVDQNFTVAENAASGTVVGTLVSSDVDAGQTRTYAITASAPISGAFAIDTVTGQVTVANPALLNFEAVTSVTLTVTVTDNGNPALSSSALVTISLTNENETPTITNQSFSVAENSASGTVIGDVAASDVDAGQSLTYSIATGNTGGAFAINTATGRITVANAAALDFETAPSFALTVRVTDNGNPGLSSTATVTINLTDVIEAIIIGLDVVPGDATNTIKLSGKFDVAILSTAAFDARTVNVSTIRFGKNGTEDSISRDKRGNRIFSYRDVNGDGRLDLVVNITNSLTGLGLTDTLAKLSGLTDSGLQVLGSSSVRVRR